MKQIRFSKYQGTGNDFVMIDNRDPQVARDDLDLIRRLCNRKFGIGSDGLILIEEHPDCDFEMIYYNPDGSMSLCGNGSRCAIRFASDLGIIRDKANFMTIEGMLTARIEEGNIFLAMPDVNDVVYTMSNDVFLNTGSPHYVRFVDQAGDVNVYEEGRKIRYSSEFQPEGTNVNFVHREGPHQILVRTYERGVEDETLSCGTGVTASALAAGADMDHGKIQIKTRGGDLSVQFEQVEKGHYRNIYLIGPAEKVFEGVITPA